ncbi:hypothetical protein DY000_02020023 [Brassica cretica]|uniref:Small EDRK-rich factor-like N-terminal domain-containing protein n=1 Tax=Brassica cretica TaxID=69181 RepID=A0ABQ7E4H7_BRACR|nr:hypothetical protein DY000_02020023 [Brassica cretica]
MSRSDHVRSLAILSIRAMSSERHLRVARPFVDTRREKTTRERPLAVTPASRSRPVQVSILRPKPGIMVKKTKEKSDAEKQEAERQESSLRGKALASEQASSGTQGTSRQQTLAAKKAKEQEKRA